ncbi:hypothetical protein [Accumulibacter sp.]|uniref:hypothetical protein n=1 Tax=Accumulibacter sp. TaxID=2053492 RepID=UPI0025FC1C80|nr:hypothetical protein [Accumulibacter sp.]MCM8595831.1 hypothetical protein [Accumulibacter sp.]MCM8626552.1 hypothetical protein [Accumulibacter sp.]MDS4049979.1 hypothetical protein [Accumulibacter sp.]
MAMTRLVALALLVGLAADAALAQFGSTTRTVRLVSADFSPVEGNSYDLSWPGPPRRASSEADRRHFTLTAKLSEPAPEEISVAFLVRENKTWDFDPIISAVVVTFGKGETAAQARFWLVCNREGRIQGNLGHDFDGYGNVYLKVNASLTDPAAEMWKFSDSTSRVQHALQCK